MHLAFTSQQQRVRDPCGHIERQPPAGTRTPWARRRGAVGGGGSSMPRQGFDLPGHMHLLCRPARSGLAEAIPPPGPQGAAVVHCEAV
eukprot:180209-Prymnesium_polylepis.2